MKFIVLFYVPCLQRKQIFKSHKMKQQLHCYAIKERDCLFRLMNPFINFLAWYVFTSFLKKVLFQLQRSHTSNGENGLINLMCHFDDACKCLAARLSLCLQGVETRWNRNHNIIIARWWMSIWSRMGKVQLRSRNPAALSLLSQVLTSEAAQKFYLPFDVFCLPKFVVLKYLHS